LRDKLSPEDENLFNRVEAASNRMRNLIEDMLVYSYVSEKPHQKEQINLGEKIKQVLIDLELDIESKEAVIEMGQMPEVMGYGRQLQQLFQNLLSNALKYSYAGRRPVIQISSGLVPGTEPGLIPDTNYYRITVRDNGIGFDEEYPAITRKRNLFGHRDRVGNRQKGGRKP
jgi:signal transduction histidine kinase